MDDDAGEEATQYIAPFGGWWQQLCAIVRLKLIKWLCQHDVVLVNASIRGVVTINVKDREFVRLIGVNGTITPAPDFQPTRQYQGNTLH